MLQFLGNDFYCPPTNVHLRLLVAIYFKLIMPVKYTFDAFTLASRIYILVTIYIGRNNTN